MHALPLAGALLSGACGSEDGASSADSESATSSESASSSSTSASSGAGTSPGTTPSTTGLPPSADTSGGPDSGDCGFLCTPDGGGTSRECDTLEQDCPRGEKCMPWASDGGSAFNATKCVPVQADPDAVGESCTVEGSTFSGNDSCDATSMCYRVDPETNTGQCHAFCEGEDRNDPTCPPRSACFVSGRGDLVVCIPHCDPALPDACGGGRVCTAWPGGFDCRTPAPDQGERMDACEYSNACGPGLYCGEAEMLEACEHDACCTPFCDLDAPACPDELTCTAYYDEGVAPEGLEHVGVCID